METNLSWLQVDSMEFIQVIQNFLTILFCRQNDFLQSPPQVQPSGWVKLASLRDHYMRGASVRKQIPQITSRIGIQHFLRKRKRKRKECVRTRRDN
jgi:hypothetical protein